MENLDIPLVDKKTPWYKNYRIYAGACLVFLFMLCYSSYRNWKYTGSIIAYEKHDATVTHTKNKVGQDVATTPVKQVPKDIYKNSQDPFIKETAKQTKAKDLVQATKASIKTADTGKTVIHDTAYITKQGDTVLAKDFAFTDDYMDLQGHIVDKDVSLSYSVNTPFTLTHKWKRPKWYKSKQLIVELIPENPHAYTTQIQTIMIPPPPKKFYETRAFAFGLGVFAGLLIKR